MQTDASKTGTTGAKLADTALAAPSKAAKDAEFEKALAELTPEQAELFVRALELAIKKRRILLFGYLSALFAIVVGMVWALYFFGSREPGTFVGWVFLVPILVAGFLFVGFGRLARSITK